MKTTRAVEHYGSVSALAEALGISRHAVYQWGDTVPELRALQIERLTGGKLRAPDMPTSGRTQASPAKVVSRSKPARAR